MHPAWKEHADRAREKLSNPEIASVVEDLVAFTGLSEDEVLFRIAKKPRGEFGARGWFYEEWDWHDPKSDGEVAWFYKSSQSYLFSNARHPSWDALKRLPGVGTNHRVFDYGGGVGMNTIALLRRGFAVTYYDLSIIQTEFVNFRVRRAGLSKRFSVHPVECEYDIIVLQDVLEHMPDYRHELRWLITILKPGGLILERSPFKPEGHKRGIPMHMEAPVPLTKFMKAHNMERLNKWPENTNLWKKAK